MKISTCFILTAALLLSIACAPDGSFDPGSSSQTTSPSDDNNCDEVPNDLARMMGLVIYICGNGNDIHINTTAGDSEARLLVTLATGNSGVDVVCEGASEVTWTATCDSGVEAGSLQCVEAGVAHDPCPNNSVVNTGTYTITVDGVSESVSVTMDN